MFFRIGSFSVSFLWSIYWLSFTSCHRSFSVCILRYWWLRNIRFWRSWSFLYYRFIFFRCMCFLYWCWSHWLSFSMSFTSTLRLRSASVLWCTTFRCYHWRVCILNWSRWFYCMISFICWFRIFWNNRRCCIFFSMSIFIYWSIFMFFFSPRCWVSWSFSIMGILNYWWLRLMFFWSRLPSSIWVTTLRSYRFIFFSATWVFGYWGRWFYCMISFICWFRGFWNTRSCSIIFSMSVTCIHWSFRLRSPSILTRSYFWRACIFMSLFRGSRNYRLFSMSFTSTLRLRSSSILTRNYRCSRLFSMSFLRCWWLRLFCMCIFGYWRNNWTWSMFFFSRYSRIITHFNESYITRT